MSFRRNIDYRAGMISKMLRNIQIFKFTRLITFDKYFTVIGQILLIVRHNI